MTYSSLADENHLSKYPRKRLLKDSVKRLFLGRLPGL